MSAESTIHELTGRPDGRLTPGAYPAVDYLARVGFDWLVETRTMPDDEDDPESVEAARLVDHARVVERLTAGRAVDAGNEQQGVRWAVSRITWPDRLPGLKTWAGQLTLAKIINKWIDALKGCEEGKRRATAEPCRDLYSFRHAATGASGFDPSSAWEALDAGFSPAVQGMAIVQRPGVELLAVVGLEALPLVSFGWRECGFVHGGRVWRFTVESREGSHYRRWGMLYEHAMT